MARHTRLTFEEQRNQLIARARKSRATECANARKQSTSTHSSREREIYIDEVKQQQDRQSVMMPVDI